MIIFMYIYTIYILIKFNKIKEFNYIYNKIIIEGIIILLYKK